MYGLSLYITPPPPAQVFKGATRSTGASDPYLEVGAGGAGALSIYGHRTAIAQRVCS